ncbi:MAG: BMP family ABC transporter substrate-binding protein [Sphaerochaetaceae bacterium]|nr:BMP family ABC transporter substrate-binding protein [Sphaerochaetaceae bacterium]
MTRKRLTLFILLFAIFVLIGCTKDTTSKSDTTSSDIAESTETEKNVLVFIPGAVDGNPPYLNLNNGSLQYAEEHPNVKIKTYEAGFNQAEWESQLTSLVASGKYDIVLTTNPSLPEICDDISKKFPNQKFIITDAYLNGNENIKTYEYNQYQQSVILGYLAGLITTSDMKNINSDKKVGFILSQEYPLITDDIIPGFKEGLQLADEDATADVRIVGNWYDASKASELALSMIDGGVDTFTSIAGGAAEGLYKVAKEKGLYVVTYDINSYSDIPGTIVGSGDIESIKLVKSAFEEAFNGTLDYGNAEIVGIEEGIVDFYWEDPLFKQSVSSDVYDTFMSWYNQVKNGTIKIEKNN